MSDPVKNFVEKCWNGLGFRLRGKPRSPIPIIFCDSFAGSQNEVETQALAVKDALGPDFEVVYFSNDPNTGAAAIRHIFDSNNAAPAGMSVNQIGTQRYGRKAKAIVIGSGIGLLERQALRNNVDSGFPNRLQIPWLAPKLVSGAVVGLGHGNDYPLQLAQKVKGVLLFLSRSSWRTPDVFWHNF